jgi:hypothetical protein
LLGVFKVFTKQLAYGVLSVALMVANAPRVAADTGVTGRLAVVAAKNFPVDDLSFNELKRIYMGDTVEARGKRVIPLALRIRSPERTAFDEVVTGMNPDDVGRYWIDRKIRGQSGPPKSIDSPLTLLRLVDKLDGALGYVRADSVPRNVKVLRIDGRRPTDAGYRLTQ